MSRAGIIDYRAAVRSSQIKAIAHNTMCAKTAPIATRLTGLASKYRTIMKFPGFRLDRVSSDMVCWQRADARASSRIIIAHSVVRPVKQCYRRALAVNTVGRLAAAV